MKTVLKVLGAVLLLGIAVIAIGISWLSLRKPAQRPASSEKVDATSERLARGKYLVEHVSDCLGCHSDHVDKFGFPVKPGTEGMGGFVFDKKLGFPGVVAAQNITSDATTGLGSWSDGEILRAIREGVDKQGNALFPMMPYEHLREMSDDDAKSVVAYLRTLKPIKFQVPDKHLDFPVNLIIKFVPKPLDGPVQAPDRKDTVAYGRYLTKIGGCYECHTPHDDKNRLVASQAFSGGWVMEGPWGKVVTANITPDPDTYLGQTTKESFIGRFRAFQGITATNAPDAAKGRNTVMPWLAFSGMTDDDLGAIYDYLKTVKPIKHRVVSFPNS